MLRGDGSTIRPRERIRWADLEKYEGKMKEGGALVLYTGWSKKWCSAEYFAHPYLTRDAAEGIMARGVKILGVDTLSPDETPEGVSEKGDFGVHETVLGKGGLIVENLANVDALLGEGNDAWSVSFVSGWRGGWLACQSFRMEGL
jgi:kynurenine formamidase